MMKPLSLNQARRVLDACFGLVAESITSAMLEEYAEVMRSTANISAFNAVLEPTAEDMFKLRCMMIYELTNKIRKPIVLRLFNKHEALHRLIRLQPLLDEMPAFAAYHDSVELRKFASPSTAEAAQTLSSVWR